MTPRWTRAADLVTTLRKRWDTGRYLRDYASGTPWQPVTLAVRGPTAADLVEHFADAVRWDREFRRASVGPDGRERFAVETRAIKGFGLGTNTVAARVRLDTFEQLCSLIDATGDVVALDEIVGETRTRQPELLPWVHRHPIAAIALRADWGALLATVDWIVTHETSKLYLRHIDVAGVDTKFVERHATVLGQLLDLALPIDRGDRAQRGFARRYGFLAKPDYTRLRLLTPLPSMPGGISEVRVRTEELATIELPIATVFVVENEVSYLAFPDVPRSIVIFGEGFHSTSLDALGWLRTRELVYWGDIDTHGFAILDRLRARVDSVRSILMDRATLLAHPTQWVTEPSPTSERLAHLSDDEALLYRDLVENHLGPAVRLEQERIRFSLVRAALQPWLAPTGDLPT